MTRSQEGGRPRLVPMSASSGSASAARSNREVRVPRRARGLRRPDSDAEHPTTALAAPSAEQDAVTDTMTRRTTGLPTGVPTTPSRVPLPDRGRRDQAGPGRGDVREPARRPVPPAWQPRPSEATTPTPATGPRSSSGPAMRSDEGDLDVLGGLVPASPPDDRRPSRPPRGRRYVWPVVAGILVLGLVGGAFLAREFWPVFFPPDFDGPGSGHVVVRVADGDSTRDIGVTLVTDGVVASARGFGQAAEKDPRGRGIQPGYYDMERGMPAAQAVTRLLDPATRLGRLDVRGGTQLDDTAGVGGARVPGVLSMISASTCVVEESGQRRCTSVDDLRRTMVTTDPARLGVPSWALDDVRRALPERRLEGLVAPGTYDVRPGSDAAEALTTVVAQSAQRLEADGLVTKADANRVTPYQALVVASIAEREGIESDFGKITRVVYNRLPIPMRLQMDSTINYPLDRQTLLTTPFDRAAPGPYNTYLNFGLPPTPIGAVSAPAVSAALSPLPGAWVYFVKCETSGASCFAVGPEEHDANRRLAQARGVY